MSEKANKAFYMIVSLLFAIAFWLYVDNVEGNTITQTFANVPVEFLGETDTLPSRGLMMIRDEELQVDLELRGPRSVITGLRRNDLRLQVNLTNISAVGTYRLTYNLLTTTLRSSPLLTRSTSPPLTSTEREPRSRTS